MRVRRGSERFPRLDIYTDKTFVRHSALYLDLNCVAGVSSDVDSCATAGLTTGMAAEQTHAKLMR